MHPSAWSIVNGLAPSILGNVEGCIIEIGMGGSTTVLAKHAKEYKRVFFSCDVDKKKCDEWRKDHRVFNVTSREFTRKVTIPPMALGFIDGDHTYSVAKGDINGLLKHLVRGGVMFIHDTTLYHRPACKQYLYIEELKQREDLQIFTWPYTASKCGLTMIMKTDFKPFLRR